jgi:dTDP-3-amino-3,4,6-trideoxy-alpha-D-glucose transaminase
VTRPALPFLDLGPGADHDAIRASLDRVVARGWFVLGPEVEAFEREFAEASGARHAVGVANGTDAITLLLRAAGVGRDDAVIVPALTAGFTGLAVAAAGATPIVADVDPETLTLDVKACETVMTSRVKAIVPVHLYGHPADLDALGAFAARHSLALVEDCCQAHLATYRGRPVGTEGIGGAFSFYPTKNLAALGDAGAVVTNDPTVADRVRVLRNGGQRQRHDHMEAGVNSRLDELQAAVLRVRLPGLRASTERRRTIGHAYRRGLSAGDVRVPTERDPGHVYHLFPVLSADRSSLQAHLQTAGIETLIHYPRALQDQGAFASHSQQPCPVARRAASDLLSLPLHPRLTDADVSRVVEAVAGWKRPEPPIRRLSDQ